MHTPSKALRKGASIFRFDRLDGQAAGFLPLNNQVVHQAQVVSDAAFNLSLITCN
jgi:hypothetical protein